MNKDSRRPRREGTNIYVPPPARRQEQSANNGANATSPRESIFPFPPPRREVSNFHFPPPARRQEQSSNNDANATSPRESIFPFPPPRREVSNVHVPPPARRQEQSANNGINATSPRESIFPFPPPMREVSNIHVPPPARRHEESPNNDVDVASPRESMPFFPPRREVSNVYVPPPARRLEFPANSEVDLAFRESIFPFPPPRREVSNFHFPPPARRQEQSSNNDANATSPRESIFPFPPPRREVSNVHVPPPARRQEQSANNGINATSPRESMPFFPPRREVSNVYVPPPARRLEFSANSEVDLAFRESFFFPLRREASNIYVPPPARRQEQSDCNGVDASPRERASEVRARRQVDEDTKICNNSSLLFRSDAFPVQGSQGSSEQLKKKKKKKSTKRERRHDYEVSHLPPFQNQLYSASPVTTLQPLDYYWYYDVVVPCKCMVPPVPVSTCQTQTYFDPPEDAEDAETKIRRWLFSTSERAGAAGYAESSSTQEPESEMESDAEVATQELFEMNLNDEDKCSDIDLNYAFVDGPSFQYNLMPRAIPLEGNSGTPAVENETTTVNNETPAVNNETPAVNNETPAVSNETSAVSNETSAVNNETSAVNNETSAVNNETSAVNNETSAVNNKTPAVNNETAAVNNEASAVNNETSAVNNETAAVQNEASTNGGIEKNKTMNRVAEVDDVNKNGEQWSATDGAKCKILLDEEESSEEDEYEWEKLLDEGFQDFDTPKGTKISSKKVRSIRASNEDLERAHNDCSIIEIYGFPPEFKTQDLLIAFTSFIDRGFKLRWVDDTHALGIFPSPAIADDALISRFANVLVRPLNQATQASKEKAKITVLPSSLRPKTCPALARRLVSGALGVRAVFTPAEREAERAMLNEAREQRRLAAKQREAAWEGKFD